MFCSNGQPDSVKSVNNVDQMKQLWSACSKQERRKIKDFVNRSRCCETHKNKAEHILDFLNQESGRNFRKVKVNVQLISSRLDEGASEEECKAVIYRRCKKWKGTDMQEYLRPATLFCREKFWQYHGELG